MFKVTLFLSCLECADPSSEFSVHIDKIIDKTYYSMYNWHQTQKGLWSSVNVINGGKCVYNGKNITPFIFEQELFNKVINWLTKLIHVFLIYLYTGD